MRNSHKPHSHQYTQPPSYIVVPVFFGVSVCLHVYLLNYRSELAQIWRQDTDTTIIPKIFHSAIMGRNGRVVLGAYFQMVFSTDLAHFLYLRYTPSDWT